MVRWLAAEDVQRWITQELLSKQRTQPIVAITTHHGRAWIDGEVLERTLGDVADIVGLETGEATWALADALPSQLEVYGGAVRIWWPGLERDSDPYEHRLYFVRSVREAELVSAKIVQAVRARAAPAEGSDDLAVATATVLGLGRNHVELEAEGRQGELRWVDGPFGAVVRCLEVGTQLPVRPVHRLEGDRWAFSTRGLLPHPWELAADALRRGNVVAVRVARILSDGVVLEVLPRVEGFCYWTYVEWDISQNEFARCVHIDEIVRAKIAEIDPPAHRLKLSIRDAHEAMGAPLTPLPSLVPGGVPFAWPGSKPARAADDHSFEGTAVEPPAAAPPEQDDTSREAQLEARIDALTNQLEAANADRKDLRDRNRDLKKQLRSASDRLTELERKISHDLDPLSSDRAFVTAVRVTYAKMFDEGTREQHPLQKLRVGSAFLDSARSLEGVELDKILDVCAQVASGMAHHVDGRDVHPLRAGAGGAKALVRETDNATAWRCALQVKSPSARRLHWWAIPGPDGQTVEFAKVGVHDDVSMPDGLGR